MEANLKEEESKLAKCKSDITTSENDTKTTQKALSSDGTKTNTERDNQTKKLAELKVKTGLLLKEKELLETMIKETKEAMESYTKSYNDLLQKKHYDARAQGDEASLVSQQDDLEHFMKKISGSS